ncbi:MAG: hypothetical protein RIC87_08640 [Kiloniellales bacterium]
MSCRRLCQPGRSKGTLALRGKTGLVRTVSGLLLGATVGGLAMAGDAEVVDVTITPDGTSTYRFDVTVLHPDTGWDHYADRWEVLDPTGNSLGVRELAHPHVNEQPFTRSLSGVAIPDGVDEVVVRARDSVDGWGNTTMTVKIPR